MNKKRFEFSERYKLFPHEVIIWHANSIGGAFRDHRYSMAEKADDPSYIDYNSVGMLVYSAKKDNLPYVVLIVHRDGTCSIKQSSMDYEKESVK